MKTITFFSYKGGVGRSMALLNAAWEMACLGKRVGIIDFDLEAPGLSLLPDFNPKKKSHPKRYGLTDLVEDRVKAQEKKSSPPRIDDYGYLKDDDPAFKKFGSIFMLPSGRVEFPVSKNIAGPLAGIQNDFKQELECEYLFVDSRTGLSDITGITTVFLPDLVFVVLGLNKQNIEGTMDVLDRLRQTKFSEYAYLVPSLIPVGSDELVAEAYEELKKRLAEFGLDRDRLLVDLALHYHPYLAVRDTPVIGKGVANILDRQYKAIAQKIIDLNPDDPRKKIATAMSLVENKDYQQALRLLGPVANRPEFAEDIEFLRLFGRVCIETDNEVIADEILQRALNIEQKSGIEKGESRTIKTALLYAEVQKEWSRGLYIDFLEKAKSFKGTEEERRTIYQRLSDAYKEPGDLFNYLRINEEIAENDPTVAGHSASVRADIYDKWGRTDDAIRLFKDEIEKFPKDSDGLGLLLFKFGEFLAKKKMWKDAVEQLSKAMEYVTKDEAVSLSLSIASIYWEHLEDQKELAIAQLKKALETYGNDERMLKRLASYYYSEGDIPSAVECRKQRMQSAPWDRLKELFMIANWSAKSGIPSVEDYEGLLQKEIKKKPKWHIPYILLGELQITNKEFHKAAETFEAGARYCESPETRAGMAGSLIRLREYPGAIDLAREVLKKRIFNKTPGSFLSLTNLFIREREWSEALKYAKKYVGLAPSTEITTSIARVAQLYRRLRKTSKALEFLKKELSQQEENIGLHLATIDVLADTGNHQEALRELDLFEKKTGKYHVTEILKKRVRVWAEQLGNPGHARELVRGAVDENRDNKKLRFEAAYCYDIIGDFDEARKIWENFKYYGSEELQKGSSDMLIQILFEAGYYQEALSELEYYEEKYGKEDKKNIIMFLKLQCHEALGQPVESVVKELEDRYSQMNAMSCDINDLRNVIRFSLRNKDRLGRAEEFVGWIDDKDIARESTKLRSCEALYYLCIGKEDEALSLLRHVLKIGHFNVWLPYFLHDLRILSKQYDIKPGRDEIFKFLGEPAKRYSHFNEGN